MKKNNCLKLLGGGVCPYPGKIFPTQIVMIMKIYALFAFFTLTELVVTNIKAQVVSLELDDQKLSDVLASIEEQTEYHFFYNNLLVDETILVSIAAEKRN